jgi:hypothetical protein
MRSVIGALAIFGCSLSGFSQFSQQYSRLGWTNDLQFQLDNMRIKGYQDDVKTEAVYFHGVNCRLGGSFLSRILFDSKSQFFIGDHIEIGLGLGLGKERIITNKKITANALFGLNLGIVTGYSFNKDVTIGLKFNALARDKYFYYDQTPKFHYGMSFYPTIRVKQVQASAGFGGGKLKEPKNTQFKMLDCELKYSFSGKVDKSWYAGVRYRKSNMTIDDPKVNLDEKSNGTFMLTCGYYW